MEGLTVLTYLCMKGQRIRKMRRAAEISTEFVIYVP